MSEHRPDPGSRHALAFLLAAMVVAVVISIGLAIVLIPERSRASSVAQMPGGDPGRGAQLIVRSGCGACHTIPGIEAANGRVGPSLEGFAARQMIAGRIPNEGPQLVRWLMAPRSVDPKTDMPSTGLNRQEASDVAAYLYTLTP